MSAQTPLTGGDGRPRKRSPAAAAYVFLLRPIHRDYLSGNNLWLPVLPSEKLSWSNIWAFFGAFIIFGIIIWTTVRNEAVRNFLILGLLFLVFLAWKSWFSQRQQRRRLSRYGKLLIGQISEIRGEWMNIGIHYTYHVIINYLVMTPIGETVNGSDSAIYMELIGKALPERGTPVAVLYLSDKEKMLL